MKLEPIFQTDEYGAEVLCAGWNPEVARGEVADCEHHDSAAHIDAEHFLERVYAAQRI